jgi:uncharacterized protein (DUF58 family)
MAAAEQFLGAYPVADPRATSPTSKAAGEIFTAQGQAHGLAEQLPDLAAEAMRIAMTISQGIHGRRRAGPGETFWQFRQYGSTDAATMIDWRRSASSDHLFVREREWEAAHTIWLWADLSPSMSFKSHLSKATKRDRTLVLILALSELLVRGGERVALLGLTKPMAHRRASLKLAEAIASNLNAPSVNDSLPPAERIGRYSGVVMASDFLDPLDVIETRLREIAGSGVAGHLIQVLDPAEESLPYDGRTEFLGMEGDHRWVADRAETLRPLYQAKLAAHRVGLEDIAKRLGWSFLVHHTDRPPAEPLLSLIMRMQNGGGAGDYRMSSGGAS